MKPIRFFIAVLTLILAVLIVTPTEAQSRFWLLVNGSLRYNGPIQVGDGAVGTPSLAFANQSGLGLYRKATDLIAIADGGFNIASFGATGVLVTSGRAFAWTASTDATAAADTQITRAAAGEISIGSTPVTFATLGTPGNGAITYCTDCTEVTPASCPATQASCVCAGSGAGAFARRVAGAWYCTF